MTGGSNEINNRALPFYMRRQYYSKAAHIIDTQTGKVERLADMSIPRQAHGMVLVNEFVYCCAGLDGHKILDSCERYSLLDKSWH